MVELGDLRGRRVLDVGCGTGRLLAALVSEAHAKAWGIDESAEMVAVARETLPAGVGVRRGTAERLPFRDGWFDRVTMSLVLHLVDRPRALAEARRVVPDDGRIAISTFHPDHFETYWLQPFFPSIKTIDAARFPTPDEMERELAAAGFPRVEMRRLTAESELEPRGGARPHPRPPHLDLRPAQRGGDRGGHRAGRAGAAAARRQPARPAGRRRHGCREGRTGCRRGHRLDSSATPLNRHSEAGKEQR